MEGEVEVVAREIVDLNRIRVQALHPREYLLAFRYGSFSEDSTFAITDLFAHALEAASAKISLRIKLHLIAFHRGNVSSFRSTRRLRCKTTLWPIPSPASRASAISELNRNSGGLGGG
jgi:hypothetical protein